MPKIPRKFAIPMGKGLFDAYDGLFGGTMFLNLGATAYFDMLLYVC